MSDLRAMSKDICKCCRNEFFSDVGIQWGQHDENWWKKDFLFCPYDEHDLYPPSNCPYRLEHMLAMQRVPV